jgi:hypothetical protein
MRISNKKIAAVLFAGQQTAFELSLGGEPFRLDREICAQNLRALGVLEKNIPFFVNFAVRVASETVRNPARIDPLSNPAGEQLMFQARMRLTGEFNIHRTEIERHNYGSERLPKTVKTVVPAAEPEPAA